MNKNLKRGLSGLLMTSAIAIGAACEPPPPVDLTAPVVAPTVKATPVPGRVALVGDSLAWTAGLWTDYYPTFDTFNKMYAGFQAENAQTQLTIDVADPATAPSVLVVALGHNDAGWDGLSDRDIEELEVLALSPAEGTCTVLVKPAYNGPDMVRLDGIYDYRGWVDQMVARYPGRIVSVDWAPLATTVPGQADDYIHFIEGEPLAVLYHDFLTDAPNSCYNAA